MKNSSTKFPMAFVCATLSGSVSWAADPAPSAGPAEDDALYTMGLNVGSQLHRNGVAGSVPITSIERGIKDGLAGKEAGAPDQMRMQAFLRSASEAAAASNAAAAREFLARNAKANGVMTSKSGLQYKIIEPGSGSAASPGPLDLVTLKFRGTLLDGSVFDSSSKPGSASTVQTNGVMRGWTEALGMMKPGAKWQLFVPPELGFGSVPRMGVPGGSLLIYEIQLVSVAPGALGAGAGTSGR